MAIKRLEVAREDFFHYRDWMKERGFVSASYFSLNGFDVSKLKKMAEQGRINAIRCEIGRSVKWYYSENQAELAYLRGEV
jgi:hypothetical protein